MNVIYKHYYKVKQISKGTIYFKIYHHNVRGLEKKACKLFSHLHPDFPHVLCLTKHHLKYPQLNNVHINPLNAELNLICHLLALLGAHHILHISRIRVKNYNLGTYCCRQLREEGAVAGPSQSFFTFVLLNVSCFLFVCLRVQISLPYTRMGSQYIIYLFLKISRPKLV
jgi:hypothetical protein